MSENITTQSLNLISDTPLNRIEHDSLDFKVYSEVITEAIVETPTPFTVGIFGKWGKGKTSLLKFIQNNISLNNNKEEKIITIFFNAWKFEKDKHPLLNLCNAIEKDIKRKRAEFDNEDIITNILDHIKYLKYAILDIQELYSSLEHNKRKEDNFEKEILDKSTYFQIFELLKSLESLLLKEKFKMLILVDDLDKCYPENSIKILDTINYILDIEGLSFVVAADIDILENFLKERYKEFNLENNEISKNYLDKMFDLPFYLPSYSGKISKLIDNIYSKNDKNINLEEDIKSVIMSISTLNILTPRLIIKLINRIKINAKIFMKINTKTKFSKEKIISLFSISCILEELYNDLFHTILKNDNALKIIIKTIQNETFIDEDSMYLDISKNEKELFYKCIEKNHKALRMIFNTKQGKLWLENRNQQLNIYEFLKLNNKDSMLENEKDLPVYKENFYDNIVFIEDENINEKEFIKIPEQSYEMSKYVVTNKWYKEFIDAKGYKEGKYWVDIASKVWLMNNAISSLDEKYSFMIEKEKVYYEKKYKKALKIEDFNKDLQPIVYITYYEAQAFCNYLSENDKNYVYSIPTNEQWDYVAKAGDENRIYPWGDTWNKNFCNNSSNQLHRTSEIGMFSQGNSKFGISDLVGNIWSWTSSLEKNEYNYLKGGSWNFSDPSYFKVHNNQMTFFNNPSFQSYDIGFFCIRTKK